MTRLAKKGREGLEEFESDVEEEEEVDELVDELEEDGVQGTTGTDVAGGMHTVGEVAKAKAASGPIVVGRTQVWRQSMKGWEPDDPSDFDD